MGNERRGILICGATCLLAGITPSKKVESCLEAIRREDVFCTGGRGCGVVEFGFAIGKVAFG